MKKGILFATVSLLIPVLALSQETARDTVPDRPERPAFESSYIIDNPTDLLYQKNTLEFMINHRMGLIKDGFNDLLGIYGSANIRLGLTYTVHDRLQVGYGMTKTDRLHDFSWKVGILKQTRSDRMPVNVTYYGNFTIDGRTEETLKNIYKTNVGDYEYSYFLEQYRYSYFHQLIISRRFNRNFSMQVAPSVSHYNLVPQGTRNDVFAVSLGGRYKISPQTAVLIDYSQPFVSYSDSAMEPQPGFSIGVEFATSGHAFQLFLANYNGLVPQKNVMFNQNSFFDGDVLIGFNITRKYNF